MTSSTSFSFNRAKAIARKEFLHVFRDPWSLGLAIVIPLVMLLLFGYALTLDVDRVPLIVRDQCNTPFSREFVSRFSASRYFTIIAGAENDAQIDDAIDRRVALASLVIPPDFERNVRNGRDANVQMLFDGGDSNTASLAMNYAAAVVESYSQKVTLSQMQRKNARKIDPPIELRPRVWYNPDLESRNAIVPGLIAISMMVIAALLTSLTVAREWERGTMEQLISTPIRGPELILGKLTPYFCIGMLDMALVVAAGQFLFHVPLRGSLILLFNLSALFLFGVLAFGILISIVAKTQLLASQFAMVATFLPAFLLSGFLYPIANMPRPVQIITYIVPARYFVQIIRGIYAKGNSLELLWTQAGFLGIYALLVTALAFIKFRKKLE